MKAGLPLREAEIVPLAMEPVDLGETSVSGYHSTMAYGSKAGLGAPDVVYEKPEGHRHVNFAGGAGSNPHASY